MVFTTFKIFFIYSVHFIVVFIYSIYYAQGGCGRVEQLRPGGLGGAGREHGAGQQPAADERHAVRAADQPRQGPHRPLRLQHRQVTSRPVNGTS